jgi:hypothetical protein
MKRGVKTKMFSFLRKMGMLCRKENPQNPRLRIKKSIDHNGNTTNHMDFIFAKSALYGVNKYNKDKKLCHYDFQKHSCRCGITLEKLKQNENCPLK